MDEHFIYIVLEIVYPKETLRPINSLQSWPAESEMPVRLARFFPHPPCMANTRAIASLTVPEGLHRIGMNRKIYS